MFLCNFQEMGEGVGVKSGLEKVNVLKTE